MGIELEEQFQGNLSATVRRHPDFRDSPFNVYDDLGKEYEQWNPPVPETPGRWQRFRTSTFCQHDFRRLPGTGAERNPFRRQTADGSHRVFAEERPERGGRDGQLGRGLPVVFQCFGNYRTPLQFALTEGDIVEHLHALQTAEHRPKRIFSELYERPLLLLGNSFPDWLTRIFPADGAPEIACTRANRNKHVADSKKDPQLRFFLRNFTINTEVTEEMEPAEFVMELAAKWTERFGEQQTARPTPTLPVAKER